MRSLGLALSLVLAGCAMPVEEPGTDPAIVPTSPTLPAPASPSAVSPASPSDSGELLTFIEEELVGTWSRQHVRNKGSSSEYSYNQYVGFLDDRTMCKWNFGEESSSDSDDGDFDYAEYRPWKVDKELGGGEYRVNVTGAGQDWIFDHSRGLVYPAGYPELARGPNTDGKSCYVR